MKKPKILLTNDDGIHAPGIKRLWAALELADFADLMIIAPAAEQSGTSVSITWNRPILIQKVAWEKQTPAWSVDATPADCVKMAERIILKQRPDLIISGINAGSNAGRNVLHSGTVGAVIEGIFRGIPGIAFSCEDVKNPNYHVAEKYVVAITRYLLANPLPAGSLLNVNCPRSENEHVKGFCWTRQGQGRWKEDPRLHKETEGGPIYWLGGKPEELIEEEHSDIAWLRKGYMTAVPIHVHELTDRREWESRQVSFTAIFEKELPVNQS